MLCLLLLLAWPAPAAAVTLVYQAHNKWVAESENAPLRKLLKAAQQGQTHYTVTLPANNRPLSVIRLGIVRNMLARAANKPVILEESTSKPAKPNTLVVK